MSSGILSEIESSAERIIEAALQAGTGVAVPGAPATTVVIGTLAKTKITFGQLVTTSKTVEGWGLPFLAQLKELVTNFGDVDNDLDVTEEVAKVLAPYIPVVGEIALAVEVLKLGYDVAKAFGGFSGAPPITTPLEKPPITSADWSHIFDRKSA